MRLTLRSVLLLLALVPAACASRGPALETLEPNDLFQHGMRALREEAWSDAVEAFERFVQVNIGHDRMPEARYRLGEAYFGRGEYITAALEFNRLAGDNPAGPWADDARFMVCRSYFELSPPPELYQEYTRTAIDHCRSLVTFYPDSEWADEANGYITELTNRLAEKEYLTAEQYLRMRALDSAIIYYQFVVEDFAGTVWAPRALLRLYEVYQQLGYTPEAEAAKQRLLTEFPDSPEARQVNGVETAGGS